MKEAVVVIKMLCKMKEAVLMTSSREMSEAVAVASQLRQYVRHNDVVALSKACEMEKAVLGDQSPCVRGCSLRR